jgi:DNA-binding CsgD family transcriptional regulator
VSEVDGLNAIAAKLDTLIRLQATSMVERLGTQRERIAFLNKVGLGAKAIAEILGTTPNTVSVTLAKMRKGSSGDAEGKD